MLPRNGTVGVSITGALTPAGLGKSCLIPLIKAGFIAEAVRPAASVVRNSRREDIASPRSGAKYSP